MRALSPWLFCQFTSAPPDSKVAMDAVSPLSAAATNRSSDNKAALPYILQALHTSCEPRLLLAATPNAGTLTPKKNDKNTQIHRSMQARTPANTNKRTRKWEKFRVLLYFGGRLVAWASELKVCRCFWFATRTLWRMLTSLLVGNA